MHHLLYIQKYTVIIIIGARVNCPRTFFSHNQIDMTCFFIRRGHYIMSGEQQQVSTTSLLGNKLSYASKMDYVHATVIRI